MSAENYSTAEQDDLSIRRCIAHEVADSDHVIGTPPWEVVPEMDPAWGEHSYIGEAFARGRTVLQGVSYGNEYWRSSYGLHTLVDPTVLEGNQENLRVGTERILELVALSRATLTRVNDRWRLPDVHEMRRIVAAMREELGANDAWENHPEPIDRPHFPGVTYDQVVGAIMDGSLRVGNPQEPTTICHSPIPFLDSVDYASLSENTEDAKPAGEAAHSDLSGDEVADAINRVTDSLNPGDGTK
jgi:hypothetical protein